MYNEVLLAALARDQKGWSSCLNVHGTSHTTEKGLCSPYDFLAARLCDHHCGQRVPCPQQVAAASAPQRGRGAPPCCLVLWCCARVLLANALPCCLVLWCCARVLLAYALLVLRGNVHADTPNGPPPQPTSVLDLLAAVQSGRRGPQHAAAGVCV